MIRVNPFLHSTPFRRLLRRSRSIGVLVRGMKKGCWKLVEYPTDIFGEPVDQAPIIERMKKVNPSIERVYWGNHTYTFD